MSAKRTTKNAEPEAPEVEATEPDVEATDTEPDTEPEAEPEADTEDEGLDFEQTEENATFLLAAAAELGLSPSVITTNNGRLQAPAEVVKAVGSDLTTDKD